LQRNPRGGGLKTFSRVKAPSRTGKGVKGLHSYIRRKTRTFFHEQADLKGNSKTEKMREDGTLASGGGEEIRNKLGRLDGEIRRAGYAGQGQRIGGREVRVEINVTPKRVAHVNGGGRSKKKAV